MNFRGLLLATLVAGLFALSAAGLAAKSPGAGQPSGTAVHAGLWTLVALPQPAAEMPGAGQHDTMDGNAAKGLLCVMACLALDAPASLPVPNAAADASPPYAAPKPLAARSGDQTRLGPRPEPPRS